MDKQLFYPKCLIFTEGAVCTHVTRFLKQILGTSELAGLIDSIDLTRAEAGEEMGRLIDKMRKLEDTTHYRLPGAAGIERRFEFVNIVLLSGKNKKKAIAKIVDGTRYGRTDLGFINLYILITDEKLSSADIQPLPGGASIQLFIERQWSDGKAIKDSEYLDFLANIVSFIALVPDKSTIIGNDFFSNPTGKIFTANAEVFPLIPLEKKWLIERRLLEELEKYLTRDDYVYEFDTSDLFSVSLEMSEMKHEMDRLKLVVERPISIPLLASRETRNQVISAKYDEYEKKRGQLINQVAGEMGLKHKYYRTNPQFTRINDFIHKVLYKLRDGFRIGALIKRLQTYLEKVKADREGTAIKWKFMRPMIAPAVDGRPFTKIYAIPAGIIGITVIIYASYLFLAPGKQTLTPVLALVGVLLIFIFFSLLSSFLYLGNIAKRIRRSLLNDLDSVEAFLTNNPKNYSATCHRFIANVINKEGEDAQHLLAETLRKLKAIIKNRMPKTTNAIVNEKKERNLFEENISGEIIEELVERALQTDQDNILNILRSPGSFIEAILAAHEESSSIGRFQSFYKDLLATDIQARIVSIGQKMPCGPASRLNAGGRKSLSLVPEDSLNIGDNTRPVVSAHKGVAGIMGIATIEREE